MNELNDLINNTLIIRKIDKFEQKEFKDAFAQYQQTVDTRIAELSFRAKLLEDYVFKKEGIDANTATATPKSTQPNL